MKISHYTGHYAKLLLVAFSQELSILSSLKVTSLCLDVCRLRKFSEFDRSPLFKQLQYFESC